MKSSVFEKDLYELWLEETLNCVFLSPQKIKKATCEKTSCFYKNCWKKDEAEDFKEVEQNLLKNTANYKSIRNLKISLKAKTDDFFLIIILKYHK